MDYVRLHINRVIDSGIENIASSLVNMFVSPSALFPYVPLRSNTHRNEESAWMTLPRLQELHLIGLGFSVATPPEGIKAEVLVVTDFDDLTQHAAEVR